MCCKIKPPKPLSLLQLNVKELCFALFFLAYPSNRFKLLLVVFIIVYILGVLVSLSFPKKDMGGILPLEPNDGVNVNGP